MAITKIYAIRDRLDKRVNYAVNAEKTTLDGRIIYVVNPKKTEQSFFTDVLNCKDVETAFQKMQATKRKFHKTDGVLGYHFIQSFAPGEVTPEQAHAIGMEFARRLFGDRYEVVIGTHLDKDHLHNHIVINSVSFVDGKKYHSSPESYYNEVRVKSDELCRENDLSVISPKGKGKHYAEWKAEQSGKPTIRSIIRADIDAVLKEAYTFQSFLILLERKGYTVQNNPKRKHITVRPPGAKRAIRLDSLGEGYTEAAIKKRLAAQRTGGSPKVFHEPLPVRRYRLRGRFANVPQKKIAGFRALYFRYLYLLRGNRRRKRYLSFSLRQEVVRLDRYRAQFEYLQETGISTPAELERRIDILERTIAKLADERKTLYTERRNAADEETKARYGAEIDRQTASLREKRRELALCRRIQADIPQVTEQVRQAQEQKQHLGKEEQKHEYQR